MYTQITISGTICSGKSTLFQDLSEKLAWPTFSTSQLFRQYAKDHNVVLETADEQEEQHTKKLDLQIREKLLAFDHLIVEGWMAGVMAYGIPNVLTVLLTCDDAVRFERFSKREQVTLAQAREKVLARETNWFNKLAKIYNRTDFFDPKYYNCIINTTHLTNEEVLAHVLQKVQKP